MDEKMHVFKALVNLSKIAWGSNDKKKSISLFSFIKRKSEVTTLSLFFLSLNCIFLITLHKVFELRRLKTNNIKYSTAWLIRLTVWALTYFCITVYVILSLPKFDY